MCMEDIRISSRARVAVRSVQANDSGEALIPADPGRIGIVFGPGGTSLQVFVRTPYGDVAIGRTPTVSGVGPGLTLTTTTHPGIVHQAFRVVVGQTPFTYSYVETFLDVYFGQRLPVG